MSTPDLSEILDRYQSTEAQREKLLELLSHTKATAELEGRIDELKRLHRYDGKDYDTELDELIDERLEALEKEVR